MYTLALDKAMSRMLSERLAIASLSDGVDSMLACSNTTLACLQLWLLD